MAVKTPEEAVVVRWPLLRICCCSQAQESSAQGRAGAGWEGDLGVDEGASLGDQVTARFSAGCPNLLASVGRGRCLAARSDHLSCLPQRALVSSAILDPRSSILAYRLHALARRATPPAASL